MRYKPNFCNNCGEKIERPNPSFSDSTRFCDVCKHDFVPFRAMPFVIAGLSLVVGLFGIGNWWRSGEKPLNIPSRQIAANPSNSGKTAVNQPSQVSSNSNVQTAAQTSNVQTNTRAEPNLTAKTPSKQTESGSVSTDEAVYFCGAMTKKGTPCSRRVRGGGRCWQHKGQTAMLPPEKLPASQ
jgi:hypothetical protein